MYINKAVNFCLLYVPLVKYDNVFTSEQVQSSHLVMQDCVYISISKLSIYISIYRNVLSFYIFNIYYIYYNLYF